MNNTDYKAIVIGASAGGTNALLEIIPKLPDNFPIPVIIVQHMHRNIDEFLAEYLNKKSALKLKEADEKELIMAGYVYTAPANYHLLINDDETFALSIDAKVNYSRPSIDVLFESAAEVYKSNLIGIILTGASKDGAEGLKMIKNFGGLTIVQDPSTAEADIMPLSALTSCRVNHKLTLIQIPEILNFLASGKDNNTRHKG